jgi:hypothetical protein
MNITDFINTYPTQIIIIMMIIIIVLIIVLILNIRSKEGFKSNLTKTGTLRLKNANFSYSGDKIVDSDESGSPLSIQVLENDLVCVQIPGTDKLLSFDYPPGATKFESTPSDTDLISNKNDKRVFQMYYVNPYQFYLRPRAHTDWILDINPYHVSKFTTIRSIAEDYQFEHCAIMFIVDGKPMTYKDMNIPYTCDTITYSDVEFTCPAKNVELHKNDSEDMFNNDNNTTMLHWWKDAPNHPNSKHYIVYNKNTGLFEAYRLDGRGGKYRFNVYGVASGCTNIARLKLYWSKKKTPDDNEQFKFDWNNNNDVKIQTKCGGYVGAKLKPKHKSILITIANFGVAHDVEVKAGKDVSPAILRMRIYSIPSITYLNSNDFKISSISVFKAIKDAIGITSNSVDNVAIGTTVRQGERKFNLKYGAYYLVPKFRNNIVYLECTSSSPSVQQFSIDSNDIITKRANTADVSQIYRIAPIKNINPNINTGEGTITLAKELCGDGRYCSGAYKRDKKVDSARVREIYIKPDDMPRLKCYNSYNVNYIPITELKLDKYVDSNHVISDTVQNDNSSAPQFNLKWNGKYLHPAVLNGTKLVLNLNSSRPSKPQFTFDSNTEHNIIVNNISGLGKFANYPIGKNDVGHSRKDHIVLINKLYGDGRYCSRLCTKNNSADRVDRIFIKFNDMTIWTCCKKANTLYTSINELDVVDLEE